MYNQGNYPSFRPLPFQQYRPNQPLPPSFQQAPPPGPPPPPIALNLPPPPPQYQYGGAPAQQPFMHSPLPPPPPVRGNLPMPPPYSQPNTSYPNHNFSQTIPPPPRMLTPPPPPPHSHGQVLFRMPPPPPLGLQHVPAPRPPVPLPSSFVPVTPSPFPPSAPPLPPPPPPTSPPPLPPSPPPPPTSPTMEFSAVPKAPSSDTTTHGIADGSVAPNETKASEDLPSPLPKHADEKDSCKDEEQNVPLTSALKVEGSSQCGIVDDEEGAVSPTASDMDMEDDVSQPDADKSIDQSNKKTTVEALSLGSEFHAVKDSFPAPRSATGQLVPGPAASSILSFTDGKDSSFLEDISPVRVEPNTAEQALENNVQQCVSVPTEDPSKINASSTPTGGETLETPMVPVKDDDPFHLIQGYASEDSEEDDRKDDTEVINDDRCPTSAVESRSKLLTDSKHHSPLTKSKEESVGRLPDKAIVPAVDPSNKVVDLQDDDKWNDKTMKREASQITSLLDSEEDDRRDDTEVINDDRCPTSAVESRSKLLTDSKHHSPLSKSKEESVGRLPDKAIVPAVVPSNEVVDLQNDDKWNDKTMNCESSQITSLLDGNSMDADHQVGKHHLEQDANSDFAKVDVDEFGRILRKGASGSDSDEAYLSERRVKRMSGRWSRSPQESRHRQRSRSPRRREKRSRSRSWSPRRIWSKSPPAARQMNATSRQDRDQPPECLDFNRGRCFRGASCRFLHRNSTRHVSKQKKYPDIPQDPGNNGNHDGAPSSELDKTAVMEMDIEECNEVPQEDSKSIEMQAGREKSGDTATNDIREVQVSSQISQEVVNHEKSYAKDALEESKSTVSPLNSSQFLQTNSMLVKSASIGSNNVSQPQDVTQPPQEGSISLHPLPHLLNQTYASQSPVHLHANLVPSNSSQSVPSKDFSPAKFPCPDVNFQPSQQVLPGPPGPPPFHHFPSDNQNAPFPSQHPTGFQSLPLLPSIFPSHCPPMISDYHSQSTPPNPGWYGIPPPTSDAMPPRHDFHSQAFQSAEPSQQPPFYMDELGRRPLSFGNLHDHPFARAARFSQPPMPDGLQIMSDSQKGYHLQNPSFSRANHVPFPGQGFASSSSFMHDSTIRPQPLPRESLPNILHSFPGEHVGTGPISREEVSSPAIKDAPYSHNPPLYGQQKNVNSSYPLNLPGSVDPSMQRYPSSFLDNRPPHYNPFASTFEQVPAGTKDVSRLSSGHAPVGGPGGQILPTMGRIGLYLQENVDVVSGAQKLGVRNPEPGDSYDPLLDSIEPSSNMPNKLGHIIEPSLAANDAGTVSKLSNFHNPADVKENSKQKGIASTENKPEVDDFGEGAADAEVGAVENASPQPVDEKDWSPDLPMDLENAAAGEIEVDQVRSPGKSKKSKDSRSMKLFKSALADFVKEVLKPSWRQGNMSKEAFKTIVKKTVEKVSGGMPSHHIPKSEAKINQYVESSQRKLTKLVMGYVDKYVKM